MKDLFTFIQAKIILTIATSIVIIAYTDSNAQWCTISGPGELQLNETGNYSVGGTLDYAWFIIGVSVGGQPSFVGPNIGPAVQVNGGGTPCRFELMAEINGSNMCDRVLFVGGFLPVELSSFSSTVNAGDVRLAWTTLSEINNSGFDIERSQINEQGMFDWKFLKFVPGNGTSSNGQNYEFIDRSLTIGKYKYRLKQIDYNGNHEYYELANEVIIGIPKEFTLEQNYPNPFNPVTRINYSLPDNQHTLLRVYNCEGKEVMTLVNGIKSAGYYSVMLNGSLLQSGVYYYQIESGEYKVAKKMLLLK